MPKYDTARVLAELRKMSRRQHREGLSRFGIVTSKALGVPMNKIQTLAKRIGRDHGLAAKLWATGWLEARCVAAYIDDPELVTPAQMDRWCRDFDNWGICDTVCFVLFDRTPHAYRKVSAWSRRKPEFEKRAAFALLASLALHDKQEDDRTFLAFLPTIERATNDDRNFVKKGVSWALRLIGRRSVALNRAALALARRLADSPEGAARWIGKDAVREFTGPVVKRALAKKQAAAR